MLAGFKNCALSKEAEHKITNNLNWLPSPPFPNCVVRVDPKTPGSLRSHVRLQQAHVPYARAQLQAGG